jgi:hypothetical protein
MKLLDPDILYDNNYFQPLNNTYLWIQHNISFIKFIIDNIIEFAEIITYSIHLNSSYSCIETLLYNVPGTFFGIKYLNHYRILNTISKDNYFGVSYIYEDHRIKFINDDDTESTNISRSYMTTSDEIVYEVTRYEDSWYKNKIFIYGDSHALFSFNNLNMRHINRGCPDITMYRIGRDNIIINFNNNEHDEHSMICLSYGEIDCRCHIKRQIDLGKDEDTVINNLISIYFLTIKNNIIKYKKIIIIGIIPPTSNLEYINRNPEYPFVGTDDDRVRYTFKMNNLLKKFCEDYNYVYFNPYNFYTRDNGTLKYEFSDNTVHLGNNLYFLEEFYKIINNIIIIDINSKNYIEDECYKYFIINNVETYSYINIDTYSIKIKDNNNYNLEKKYYLILDFRYSNSLYHFVAECTVYFPLFHKLKKQFPLLKIILKEKRNYHKSFADFYNINSDDLVYELDNNYCNNLIFTLPTSPLNSPIVTDCFKIYTNNLLTYFNQYEYEKEIDILVLPRQKNDNNYHHRKSNIIDIINNISNSNNKILNTDEITDLREQIKYVKQSKIIIMPEGSVFFVNGLFSKNSKIIILGNYMESLFTNDSIFPKNFYYYNMIKNINNNDIIIIPYKNGDNFDNSTFLYSNIVNYL